MKREIKIITSILLLFLMATSVFAYGNGNNVNTMRGKGYGQNQGGIAYQVYDDTQINHQTQIDQYSIEDLSDEEIAGLLLMREEEKLARDVYLELYDIWGQQIFSNIASSEETHTQAVLSLIEKYDLTDPVVDDSRGVFANSDLQTLYNNLVQQGSNSLVEALKVGATVEDLDIKDLQELNAVSDNQDITAVYNNLEKGSRNHLRSFTSVLESRGETYTAQYVSEEEYNSIVSQDLETGTQYDSVGNMNQVNSQNRNSGSSQMGQNNNVDSRSNQGSSQGQQVQAQNMFANMWKGFKSWFN